VWTDIVVLTKRPDQFIMISKLEIVRVNLHYEICVQHSQITVTRLTLNHRYPNKLLSPQSLAMDEIGDRLYISDNYKIMECQVDGTFIKWIGAGILDTPVGLCLQNDHLCVCDYGHRRISIRHTGTLIKHILANPSTLRPLYIISLGDQLLVSYQESKILHVVEFEAGTCRTVTLPFEWNQSSARRRTILGMTLIDNIVFMIDSDNLVHRLG
jgi:hypothetical protein